MTQLFTPFKNREITFRNRIAVSPMCQYSSTNGYANEWHLVHLASRSVGGARFSIYRSSRSRGSWAD